MPLYVLQGLGRGIFESTNKAVIADYCPGAKAESGFANFVILSGSASTLMFFLIPILTHHPSCAAQDAADEKSATVCGHQPRAPDGVAPRPISWAGQHAKQEPRTTRGRLRQVLII